MIHHCHRCELRFRSDSELTEHLSIDHDADVTVFERFHYPSEQRLEPLYADLVETPARGRRYLVVANQTLHSPELEGEVLARLEEGPAEVIVLVPATHSADYGRPVAEAGVPARPTPDEPGLAQARWRLRRTIGALREGGAVVTGYLGPADPFAAVAELIAREPVDEIIMSTLPAEASRWLALDVPARIRRRLEVPVTLVSASGPVLTPSP
jgi:hypothetical protein